jgi:hypothetical protein
VCSLLVLCVLQHNTLPVIFKSEMPARIGLLPLTAKSGDEVSKDPDGCATQMLGIWGLGGG